MQEARPTHADEERLYQKLEEAHSPVPLDGLLIDKLCARFTVLAAEVLGIKPDARMISRSALEDALNRCAVTFKGTEETYHILMPDGQCRGLSRMRFVSTVAPSVLSEITTKLFKDTLEEQAELIASASEKADFKKRGRHIGFNLLADELVIHRSATEMEERIDMFSKTGSLTVEDGALKISLPFKLFKVGKKNQAVVDDYKAHFPDFVRLLCLLLYSRFVPDRRQSYLWLKAESDWGKGLLLTIFENLGILVDVPAPQLNKIIAQDTVGVSAFAFRNAWILSVDEWTYMSKEIKQLNRSIYVTAKYALRVKAELYLKLFTSRDDVPSLTGDGVEEQANNRFSGMTTNNLKIKERPLFKEIGPTAYIEALTSYTAEFLNGGVTAMRELGSVAASMEANKWIDEFHQAHLLSDVFGDMTAVMAEKAKEIQHIVRCYGYEYQKIQFTPRIFASQYGLDLTVVNQLVRSAKVRWVMQNDKTVNRAVVLSNAADFVEAYLKQSGNNKVLATKLSKRKGDIADLMHEPPFGRDYRGRIMDYGPGHNPLSKGNQMAGVAINLVAPAAAH